MGSLVHVDDLEGIVDFVFGRFLGFVGLWRLTIELHELSLQLGNLLLEAVEHDLGVIERLVQFLLFLGLLFLLLDDLVLLLNDHVPCLAQVDLLLALFFFLLYLF